MSLAPRSRHRTMVDDVCLAAFPAAFACFCLVYWPTCLLGSDAAAEAEGGGEGGGGRGGHPWEDIDRFALMQGQEEKLMLNAK